MELLYSILSIWICAFLIARLFSIFSGRLGPFGKTYWKNDLAITFAQSIIITILLEIL